MIIINITNPLTPIATMKTLLYQVGLLGFGSAFVYLTLFPWAEKTFENSLIVVGEFNTKRYANSIIDFLFGYIPSPWRNIPTVRVLRQIRPAQTVKGYIKTRSAFILYFLLRFSALVIILQVLGALLTSVGWRNPLTWGGFYYDLIFGRVNNAPNAAHLTSYLGVVAVGIAVLVKFRKNFTKESPEMIALITCALTVAIHEGLWIIFYWAAYGQYLFDLPLLPNLIVDAGFSVMIILFVITYSRYKAQRLPIRIFEIPSLVFAGFLAIWFFLPHILSHGFYPALPITTLNNWKFGQGVFNETPWYNDPLPNSFEVLGWVVLAASMILAIWRFKTLDDIYET